MLAQRAVELVWSLSVPDSDFKLLHFMKVRVRYP